MWLGQTATLDITSNPESEVDSCRLRSCDIRVVVYVGTSTGVEVRCCSCETVVVTDESQPTPVVTVVVAVLDTLGRRTGELKLFK